VSGTSKIAETLNNGETFPRYARKTKKRQWPPEAENLRVPACTVAVEKTNDLVDVEETYDWFGNGETFTHLWPCSKARQQPPELSGSGVPAGTIAVWKTSDVVDV
jgi:hypothetical protein